MGLPPLPPGFQIEKPPPRRDPADILRAEGFEFTNGFRTDADVERIREQGYKPASDGAHNRGDGVDLVHPSLTPAQQKRRLEELFGDWGGARVLDEGHHRHLQLPGWQAAPGTPGTPNSGLPAIPAGFELHQRGSLKGGNFQEADSSAPPTPADTQRDGAAPGSGYRTNVDPAVMGQLQSALDGGRSYSQILARARSLGVTESPTFLSDLQNAVRWRDTNKRRGARFVPGDARPIPDAAPPEQEPALANRLAAAANRGVATTLGAPVDLMNAGLGAIGVPVSDRPFGGSENILDAFELSGYLDGGGKPFDYHDPSYAPQSDAERYGQRAVEFTAGNAIPTLGLIGKGSQIIGRGAVGLQGGNALTQVGRDMAVQVARRPGVAIAGDVGASVGAAVGGELARDIAPDSAGGEVAGQLIGGLAGGLSLGGVAATAGRSRVTPRQPLPALPEGYQLAEGPHGPIHRDLAGDYPAALARLRADQSGEVPGAIRHPDLGDVDLVWGDGNYGLSKIVQRHPEVVDDLPAIVERLPVRQRPEETGNNRFVLEDDTHRAVVAPDFNGVEQRWLVTAFERKGAPGNLTSRRDPLSPDGGSTGGGAGTDINPPGAPGNAAMVSDDLSPTLIGPAARAVDRIDVNDLPPMPPGFVLDEPALGRVRPAGERLPADEIARMAQEVDPGDVTPGPTSRPLTQAEAEAAQDGSWRPVAAPDEYDELASYRVPSKNDPRRGWHRKGPVDLVSWLRSEGGLRDSGGELRHMGIDNKPRRLDFAGNEHFFGKLVDDENGLDFDDAALRAWEAGFFPDSLERPTIDEFLDALRSTHTGGNRVFRPDDFDEVDRFYSAQAERGKIETAAQEGSPIYEDIGQEITFDDLDARSPPASAYEDAPRLTGKLGNINLERLESPGDVARLIRQVQGKVGGFDEASRGVVTNQETRALADELGMTPEQLLRRRRGQALNAEQLYATRVLVQKSREVVARLAKASLGGSDEQVAQFRNAWMRHVALEEQVTAATAEVGRAMQSFKMLARSGDAKADAVRAYLRGGGGRETVEDAAKKLVDLMDDPAAANRFMRDGARVRKRDMFNELWVNSLLSGPKTHVVNAASNTFTALYTLPEQALTAGIGRVLGTKDRALFGEIGKRAVGMMEGAREGLTLAKRAFLTGEPGDAVSKVEAANYHSIPGRAGEIIRLPTRTLMAADEFFKAVNRRAAINAMAYRRSHVGGGSPAERMQRFNDLKADPDKALRDFADDQARYLTFQRPLGDGGRGVMAFVNNVPGAKLIIPFVRTPINLLKFAGERSVFAPALKEFREAWKAGGNTRNEAVAKMTLGTGLSALAVSAALDGRLSGGGPSDPRERAALMNSGWQPYSLKLGDKWVSYQRFDPLSMLIGAAADFSELGMNASARELDEMALGLATSVAKNVTSKTWLSGLSDFFEVLTDPERYGKNWVERMAGSLAVPALSSHAAGAMDPYLREVNGILDAVKNRVPGLSHDLSARRNVWGDEIKKGNGAGGDALSSAYSFISPVSTSSLSKSPLLREVARLRAPLSMPQRKVRSNGVDQRLNPEQYAYYVQLSGKPAKLHLEEYIKTPEWQGLTDDERRDYLRETLAEFREDARGQLFQMFPELNAEPDLPPLPPGFQLPPMPAGFEMAR